MSRSDPPRSSIVARLRQSSGPAAPAPARRRALPRRAALRLAAVTLWLHIYGAMLGLAAVLFFSVTGLTLNHPGWFFKEPERRVEAEGRVDPKWLHLDAPAPAHGDPPDPSREVARLEVVEHLRTAHGVRGAVAEFRV